ncbi:N-acetylglucosamine-6-phosphate deacetylase [Cohnella suwonensis]|uniref:N-acetylglucosamine-6-phosphate deacetylase n=1 Tax=Cohnella suwonensis TaxID=696072 RepID=A0ABW0LVI1_9BACL
MDHTGRTGSWKGKDIASGLPIAVEIEDGIVRRIRLVEPEAGLPWLSAGWIDLQVNGCGGGDLNGPRTTAEDVEKTTRWLWSKGVSYYLPTVITASRDRMGASMAAIDEACSSDADIGASIGGIHMEGPYISPIPGPRGAHVPDQVRLPDTEEFEFLQRSANGRIALVTLAPELEGAESLIRTLTGQGIVASIGHSAATSGHISAAANAGATMSTHLGNGSHLELRRHPNYIWDQLAEDRLHAGLIADGHHLPLAVLRTMLRAKGTNAFLVSDCSSLAGMPPGIYSDEIGGKVELREDGYLGVLDQPGIMAGSASTLDQGLLTLLRGLSYSLPEAIALVTERPAAAMGWQGFGRLEPGAPGYLTLFEYDDGGGSEGIRIAETVVNGVSVYRG